MAIATGGSKMWINKGGDAETLVVYAKTNPDAGPKGITAFILEKGFRGPSFGSKLDKLGMRGSSTYLVFFEDCEVPEENVLGGVGEGVKMLVSGWTTSGRFSPAGHWGSWLPAWMWFCPTYMSASNLAKASESFSSSRQAGG